MPYEPMILQRATARLNRRREMLERRRFELERRLYAEQPILKQLDAAIQNTMMDLTDLIAAGKPVQADGPEIAAIRTRNLALQAKRADLLAAMGYSSDALDDKPACPDCGDTGWMGMKMCHCLRELCAQEQLRELSSLLNLTDEQSFDKLRLDVYSNRPWEGQSRSPREQMRRVVEVCWRFSRQFPDYPLKNLLFSGGTGLGKTFLSGCVAREVSDRGFSVVYDTAIHFFLVFETRRFARDQEESQRARGDTRRYLACDLLILDDLGSEMTSPLSQASLYEVINSRLLADKRTIISTNLSQEQIAAHYTPQITSRIRGLFRELTFFGEDIRLKQ